MDYKMIGFILILGYSGGAQLQEVGDLVLASVEQHVVAMR
jgi:hypothetical protein